MGKFSNIIIVSDFDRTITNHENNIPQANLDAVERFMEEGGLFTIATGRARQTFEPQLRQIHVNAPCVLFNGALIYDFEQERTIELEALPDEAEKLVRQMRDKFPDTGLEVYLPEHFYAFNDTPETQRHFELIRMEAERIEWERMGKPWVKAVFSGETGRLDEMAEYVRNSGYDSFTAVRSLPYLLEIGRNGVNKGNSARRLCQLTGRQLLVCVGDAANDIGLLDAGDLSFVPSDCDETVASRGYLTTISSAEGTLLGVVNELERRIL